ncbi:MAG: arylsulfatase [Planctomycetota bacterium]
MKKRRFQIFVFPGPLALLVFLVHGIGTVGAAESPRPNVLLIMADDLGYSDLGCYGGEIETPNLDRLAADGMRFRTFYNTAKCHTSRVALLSGLHSFQAAPPGSTRNEDHNIARGITLGQLAQSAGYFTAALGKWDNLVPGPMEAGFDRFFGYLDGITDNWKPRSVRRGRREGEDYYRPFQFNGKDYKYEGEFYSSDAYADFTMSFIDEANEAGKPFFVYLGVNAPHYPLHAPEASVRKYVGRYRDGWLAVRQRRIARQRELGILKPGVEPASSKRYPLPDWSAMSNEEREWQDYLMAVYAGMVDRLDWNIGRIVEHLRKTGQLDNTLIFFCSDNGACHETMSPARSQHEKQFKPWQVESYLLYGFGWAHVSNTPFHGYKASPFEGGIASPGIVHWPAGLKVKPGTISDEKTHLIDWMPTLIELTGGGYPKQGNKGPAQPLPGTCMLPAFEGKALQRELPLYFRWGPLRGLIDDSWKITSYYRGPFELFHLANDPCETRDVAGEHPEQMEALEAEWWRIAREVDELPPMWLTLNDQPRREIFRGLISKKGEERE